MSRTRQAQSKQGNASLLRHTESTVPTKSLSDTHAKHFILIFPGFFLPHKGGLENYVDEFAHVFGQTEKYTVHIFAPNIPSAPPVEVRGTYLTVIRYPAFEIVSNYAIPNIFHPLFWKQWHSLYKAKPTFVFTQTRFFANTFLGYVYARWRLLSKNKISLVHVEHGSSYVKVKSNITNAISYMYDQTIGRLVLAQATSVVAISKAVESFCLRLHPQLATKSMSAGGSQRISVIYRGLAFEKLDEAVAQVPYVIKQKIGKRLVMSYAGRLYTWKGVAQIVSAYKLLPKSVQEKCAVVIAGDGEDMAALQKLADNHLNQNIFFTGALSYQNTIGLLKSSDIYVHAPYPGGGLSTSLLEAMDCGCAVIASPNEGASEVVGTFAVTKNDDAAVTGMLLPSNDAQLIADAITVLVSDAQLRKSLGTTAHTYVRANFDWQRALVAYESVFKSITHHASLRED